MTTLNPNHRFGLVLTGGGARAAYQAGVLKGISDVLGPTHGSFPFRVLTGISAGAINAAYLACRAERFDIATDEAVRLWGNLRADRIMKTDAVTLGRLGAQWVRNLGFGGGSAGNRAVNLLDTEPLRKLLQDEIRFDPIQSCLSSGQLHGVAFSATNYHTGTAVTFFDGHPEIQPWVRSSRIGKRTPLNHDHVLASASIPILFRPVRLENSFFGDGGVRMRAPISPAIHLGADRILAIGIRYFRPEDMTAELDAFTSMSEISVADIAGVLLNAVFMDALEGDVERMVRINQTLALMDEERRARHPSGLRPMPLLVIRPSKDLCTFASDQFENFPRMLRHLLRGIGASNERGWDLLSYLAFDKTYTSQLIDLGHSDAMARRDEILEFFTAN